MPIVQAGNKFTAADLQRTAGRIATGIRDSLQTANDLKVQLESWPDADLLALGLSQEEVNAIKGFYVGDLPALYTAFTGSQWVKQLLGLGV